MMLRGTLDIKRGVGLALQNSREKYKMRNFVNFVDRMQNY
jgi:hypothetical protein